MGAVQELFLETKRDVLELKKDLISRKYHTKVIDEAFHKLRKISRVQALEKSIKRKRKGNTDNN